jgi:choline-sulfatase
LLRGLLAALAGASLGAGLAACLDARAAGVGWLTNMGLLAPLAVPVGLAAWALRAAFWSGQGLSLVRFDRWLAARQGAERAAWLVTPPLVALALPLGLLAVAGSAARVLGAEVTGRPASALMALSVLPLSLSLVAAVRLAADAAMGRAERVALSPRTSLLVSLSAFVALVALLIALGETSGAGGASKILGVLRREELDLRAPSLLLLFLLGASCLPSPRRLPSVVAALLLPLSSGLCTLWAARSLEPAEALAVERQAPLGRSALALLRRVSDRDGDGMSAAFAGGDCDDSDASISPRAVDVPGNGKDDDCFDGDARPLSPSAPPQAAPVAADPAAELPADLNLILVTIDTLRADLGYAGNPRNVSPNLDALAARSVVFENAYSLASYTGKSMGPLMIGKYSSELEGGFLHFNRFSKNETFIQERLQAAGVRTLSVQGYWYFFKDAGFERGFDVSDSSAAPKVAAIEGDQSSNSDEQSDAVIQALASPELASRRFFMWVHYVDPHAEYARHPQHDFGPKPRDRYDGEVAFVDAQFGRVLAALEQAPFASRTAIIVTSDHGEAFGEHGMIRHGFELWEELTRVPLLVSVPGVPHRRVSARRSAIDIVPTILDLYKLPLVPRGPKDFLSGKSLLADLLPVAGVPDEQRPVFIDMARGPHNAERQALIVDDQKLTVSEGRVLGLYDLAEDPGETRDLSSDRAKTQRMQAELQRFKSRLRVVPLPR